MIQKTIKLQIGASVPPAVINCTETDTMWEWHFQLYYDGTRWTIPTGAEATFSGLKKDGNVFDVEATISSNEVVVSPVTQMTTVAGDVFSLVRVIDTNGKIIAACPVLLRVFPNPQSMGTLSESAVTAYDQAIQRLGESMSVPGAVTDWLDEHILGGAVVDDTLTISGAAADAKKSGDELSQLKSAIKKTAIDYFALEIFSGITTGTHKGVTFTKGNNVVTANGTATGGSAQRVYWSKTNPLPSGLVAGETVTFYVNTSDQNLRLVVIFYDSSDTQIGTANYFISGKDITVPNNAAHASIYLDVPSGSQISNATIIVCLYRKLINMDAFEELNTISELANDANRIVEKASLNKYVTSDAIWEIGGIGIDASGYTYGTNNKRIRIKDGYRYTLNKGDKIGLTNFSGYKLLYAGKKSNGTYGSNTITSETEITEAFTDCIAVIYYSDERNISQSDIETLSELFYVKRSLKDEFPGVYDTLPLPGFTNYKKTTQTLNGVTFSWDNQKKAYYANGTASAYTLCNVLDYSSKFPNGVSAGDTFILSYASSDQHVYVRLRFYKSDSTYTDQAVYKTGLVTVPNDAIGFNMYLGVYIGQSVDGYISLPLLLPYALRRFVVPQLSNPPKYISFVDDDTSTDIYVTRYYQNCMHNGIRGNYAVCTKRYTDNDNDIDILKNAEADGFCMAVHCDSQETYLRPNGSNFNEHNARLNYIRAINAFRTLGLLNPQNMWVIPYGSRDAKTHQLAADLGFDIAFTTDGDTYNKTTDNDVYWMHRTGLSSSGDVTDDTDPAELGTMARCKARVDELVNSVDGGWLIITTHFNEWDDMTWDSTLDSNGYAVGYSRFNEFVQYALTAGLTPISLAEGSLKWKQYIDRNAATIA